MNFRIKTEYVSIYLELPCREEKIEELCKSLGIPNTANTEVTVYSVYLNDGANALFQGKTLNLDKLNYLAKRLDSFEKSEITTFYAVAYGGKIEDIDSLINLTFNTHCASIVRNFSDLDAVGKEMYLNEQVSVSLRELEELNGAAYFQSVMENNPNPTVTPYGIIYKNKNEFEQVFDGTHFPQYEWERNMGTAIISKGGFDEYLYLPFAETELQKALERLGANTAAECSLELDNEYLTDEILAAITKREPIQNKLMELSNFTKLYAEIGIDEKPNLDILVEMLEPKNKDELYALVKSLHEFEIFADIHSAEEYGRYMICESGHFEYDENLEPYIQFERYGNQRLQYENGALTDQGYILYHGYNMELSAMLDEIGIKIEPQQSQTLKLYMPLKGTTYYDENDYGDLYQVDFEMEVYPEELAKYEDEIQMEIENNSLPEEKKRGLMKYYSDNDSVNSKVKRYDLSVEVVDGKLMGVATMEINAPLDDKEIHRIMCEIEGQCSDGWGEGFEQRGIKCNGREIYVSFWQSKNWSLQTAEELGIAEKKQELTMGGM